MKNKTLITALILALAAPLGAIELSLEENRAERGNIGYVDTQRLFKLFPETIQARENFAQAVRQAEDQINQRKADMLRLRKEIGELKVERAVLAKSTPAVSAAPVSAPAPAPVPAVSVSTPAAASGSAPTPAISTSAMDAPLPGFGPAASTAAAAQPLVIDLPGATAGPVEVAPPAAQGQPSPEDSRPPLPEGTPPAAPAAAAPEALPAGADAPAAHAAALAALDERISQKEAELARREAQAREEQDSAEKNLLDLESRRSEILLGKIYRAVQETARREGVSVVVDKTGILYGHNAVDLTEKVLTYLKGG
jgi:Skp family chaperone for outer membrane proteins